MSGLLASARAASLVRRPSINARQVVLIALGPALVIAALLTLRSEHLAQPGFRAAYVVASIAASVLIGIAWGSRRPASRTGPLLVVLGTASWVISWLASDIPLLYVAAIGAEPIHAFLIVYIALAFPGGRLTGTVDRVTLGTWAIVVASAWIGAILLVRDLGPTSPLAECTPACPPNPFVVGAVSLGGMQLGWAVLAVAGAVALTSAALLLVGRTWRASPAQRRELGPVAALTGFYVVALVVYHGARFAGPAAELVAPAEAALVVARLAFPFGFLAALLAAELFAVGASRRLTAGLASPGSIRDVEQRLSGAVQDPDLLLGIWDIRGQAYRRTDGRALDRASASDRQMWVSVRDNGDRLAAVVTDAGFAATPQLADALRVAALLDVRALTAAQQVEALRARAVETADAERKRIARDLHDSAQQRLVALRVHLMLAMERPDLPDHDRAVAERLVPELDLAIDELRRLARRVLTPAALGNGVVPAIRALAENWEVRVTVRARGLTRHPADVELAVYNCCLEALQNVADHAGPRASVEVRLVERHGTVRFVVADDGVGFDPAFTERGAGLARIVDRAALAGGCATIRTAPGRGVRVSGMIPAPPAAHAT